MYHLVVAGAAVWPGRGPWLPGRTPWEWPPWSWARSPPAPACSPPSSSRTPDKCATCGGYPTFWHALIQYLNFGFLFLFLQFFFPLLFSVMWYFVLILLSLTLYKGTRDRVRDVQINLSYSPKSANNFMVRIPTAFLNNTGLSSSIIWGFPSFRNFLLFSSMFMLVRPLASSTTSRHSTVQYSTVQYNTVQYSTYLQTRLPSLLLLEQVPRPLNGVEGDLRPVRIALVLIRMDQDGHPSKLLLNILQTKVRVNLGSTEVYLTLSFFTHTRDIFGYTWRTSKGLRFLYVWPGLVSLSIWAAGVRHSSLFSTWIRRCWSQILTLEESSLYLLNFFVKRIKILGSGGHFERLFIVTWWVQTGWRWDDGEILYLYCTTTQQHQSQFKCLKHTQQTSAAVPVVRSLILDLYWLRVCNAALLFACFLWRLCMQHTDEERQT